MNPLRFGVVGVCGAIGATHVRAIEATEGACVAAVTDLDLDGARRVARVVGCEAAKNFEWLAKRGDVDVVSLCTPHAEHCGQALFALKNRKHVLVERPLATHVADADKVIKAAEKAGRTATVANQCRHRPAVRAAKGLLAQGEIGRVYRATLVHTAFKTQHFYDSAPWRGTWEGAGGGVLMHQGLAYLDLLVHLLGLPKRVVAWRATLAHDIAVEDSCSALGEYPDGAQLTVHLNSFQIPGESHLEIVGDRGTLRLEGNSLRLYRPSAPLRRFIAEDRSHLYAYPDCAEERVAMPAAEGTHAHIVAETVDALRDGRTPPDSAADSMGGLELSNALLVSSHTGKPADLPLKRSAARRALRQLSAPPKAPVQEAPS